MNSKLKQSKPSRSSPQMQNNRVPKAHRIKVREKPEQNCNDQAKSYARVCQERYMSAFHRYNAQFRKEIEQHILYQPNALDAMRVHRSFAITMLWPPLHSKREINAFFRNLEVWRNELERKYSNTKSQKWI